MVALNLVKFFNQMIFSKSKEAVVFLFLFFTIAHSRVTKVEADSPCISQNGWGLTKFKKYQMKKIRKAFFKFCLSPCYVSVKFLIIIFCEGILTFKLNN